ncbi:SNF2 family helicase/ATPase [Penicillium hetheringtonii]|uniref:SNF2 family helicase/ATPase n=1 Tax=Penicillium hetheringtonii TaxID=911720 RepID=A0AAD6DXD5_9EURO|nr:SNF2 family helicase/ATPase [Penicillium hetheringtonii]
MASHAAMLLDPKGYKKRLQRNGATKNPSSQDSAPSIAPPGTAMARTFDPEARKSSSRTTSAASSPAPSSGHTSNPIPDSDVNVQFTTSQDDSNDSDAKRSHYEISEDENETRPRNMIENIYGVEQRTYQPVKKVKVDDAQTKNSPTPIAMTGDSGLGQWMKEGSPTKTSSVQDIVDLTADAAATPRDDEDLQVTGSNDLSKQRVCYGKIENTMVNAFLVPKPISNRFVDETYQWPSMKMEIHRGQDKTNYRIDVSDASGKVFGTIDSVTAKALCPLLDIDPQHFKIDVAAPYRASITLYGERQRAQMIGNYLGQKNLWLGQPITVERGVPVFNPHAEKRQAMASAAANNAGRDRSSVGIRYEVRTAEEVNDAVMKMFDQLVTTNIPSMEPPPQIKTPLLHHQKQGLWYMTDKEKRRRFGPKEADNNSLWRIDHLANGKTQYRDIISGVVVDQEPPQSLGGLLADMMGLGKTLSILSLALSTLDQSQAWTDQPPGGDSAVNNWISQIKEHIEENALSYYVFHGPSRTTDLDELSTYDLIITTYSTVLSEIKGQQNAKRVSPLTRMNMFRIVLDEAHTIREQNAQQTQAILSLNSQRRWSVTGTPIQNRLDDLLSVTKFLKLFPYDDRGRFGHYILSPFKSGDPRVLASLRVLDEIIMLEFSEKETQLHEFFRRESNVMMRVIAGESKTSMGGRVYHHVLKAMMILRQVSAHGKELLDVEDRERTRGLSVQDAIDLEEGTSDKSAAAADKKAYDMFALMQQTGDCECRVCRKTLKIPDEQDSENGYVDQNAPIAVVMPCFDVFCPDCFAKWYRTQTPAAETIKCQICDGWVSNSYSRITPAGLESFLAKQESDRKSKKNIKQFGEYEGPHTKTLALIERLQSAMVESEQLKLKNEPPIKSVIFSTWTSHLDLIEIALSDKGMNSFTRLDGTMSLQARGKALEAFAKDDSITILLATIGAGGVGLNLTSASQVFIMEPQYNPASVAQAVDRVHRLGQTRPVKTVQFIMKGSIEEKILELAKKKQQLADMSMNRGKLDKREIQEERMREYRSLFK